MNGHFEAMAAVFASRTFPGRDGGAQPSTRAVAAHGPHGVSIRPRAGARADSVGVEAAP